MASLVTQSEPNYINLQFVDSGFNNAQSYHSDNSDYISTESEPPDSENEPWKYWGNKSGDYGESFLEFKGRIMCNDKEITKEEFEEADKTSCYIDVPAQTAVAFNRLIRNIDSTVIRRARYDIDRYSKKVNVAIEACKIFYKPKPKNKDDTSEGDVSESDDDIDINWTNIDPPNGKSAEFFQFNNLGYEYPSRNLYFAHSDNLNHVNEEEVLKARKDNYEREFFKVQVINSDTLKRIRIGYNQALQTVEKGFEIRREAEREAHENIRKELKKQYEKKLNNELERLINEAKDNYYRRKQAQKAQKASRKKSRPTEEQFKIKLKF